MDRNMRLVSALFLILLLAATEMGPKVAEATDCESPSNTFNGPCLRESTCASVCQSEGFNGGHCRGLRLRCFCTAKCR